jgi:Flp pilus assembly secretin CpaC
MTYIRINTKSKQAKKFIELIETMPFAEILAEPNVTTKKAMESAKQGKSREHKSASDLISCFNK